MMDGNSKSTGARLAFAESHANATQKPNLLILGASVRAAAWSALGSGTVKPWCIDLFADTDLTRHCAAQSIPLSAYPHGFLAASRQAPPGPWLYTGALENYPDLIEAIARERPLWGNPPHVVRKVRSPTNLAEHFQKAKILCPSVMETPPTGNKKNWLVKPRRGAGGAGIRPWHGEAVDAGCYFQEHIEGMSCSALYVGRDDNAATFLGATRQLVGAPWLNANGFQYCGNVGPLKLRPKVESYLERIGSFLAQDFGLRGFFGVDFILQHDTPWPVEVNPRFTAGLEVLERAAGQSFFGHHHDDFFPLNEPSPAHPTMTNGNQIHGKAILFARDTFVFPGVGPWNECLQSDWSSLSCPDYADIPHPGSRIEKGQPILTLFAHADTEDACAEILRGKAQALDRKLFA